MPAVDTITIKDLGVLCKIGVPDEERAKPQRLLITVEISGDFSQAAQSDDIAHTINYYDVSQRITSLCTTQSFKLIERLADEIARILLKDFGAVQATVEVKKFILSNARHVSFRLARSR
ncbi:MAG: dihydroneopterin aldolase [Limisphaerales bacterium]